VKKHIQCIYTFIWRILEKHPAFGQAAMMVAAAVCEEGSKMEAGAERLAPGMISYENMTTAFFYLFQFPR